MTTALVLSGGPAHPYDQTTPMLLDRLAEVRIAASATRDPAHVERADVDLLVVECLRWPMESPEKYRAMRDTEGYRVTPAFAEAVTAHVAAGRGLLALHAAVISFGDWPGWGGLLGAAWEWGVSHHPPYGPCRVRVVGDGPLVDGLADWDTVDERYSRLRVLAPVDPLVVADVDGIAEPLAWVRETGGGRVAYLGLGHGVESHSDPTTRELQRRLAGWAVGTR